MKRIILTCFILLMSFNFCLTQPGKQKSTIKPTIKDTVVHEIIKTNGKIDLVIPESISLKISGNNTEAWWEKNMPWIIAALISACSIFINFTISRNQRRTTLETVQIQIKNSENLAIIGHKSKIASTNRQEWINTLRDCITEYLVNLGIYNMKVSSVPVKKRDLLKIEEWEETKKISYYRWKIKLLLHSFGEGSEQDHVALDNVCEKLVKYAIENYKTFDNKNYSVLVRQAEDISQSIIKKEWDRVSKFEKELNKKFSEII